MLSPVDLPHGGGWSPFDAEEHDVSAGVANASDPRTLSAERHRGDGIVARELDHALPCAHVPEANGPVVTF
jgi:hypothetical protein